MATNPNRRPASGAPELTTIEARQGVTVGRMRYVLAGSVILAIAAMALVYLLS